MATDAADFQAPMREPMNPPSEDPAYVVAMYLSDRFTSASRGFHPIGYGSLEYQLLFGVRNA